MPKLTNKTIWARLEAYDQAALSLELGRWAEDDEEVKQGKIVAKQIRKLQDKCAARINLTEVNDAESK